MEPATHNGNQCAVDPRALVIGIGNTYRGDAAAVVSERLLAELSPGASSAMAG